MVYYQTKNPNLGKFGKVLQLNMLVNFMAIWSIFLLFGTFYGYLQYFMVIWYVHFPVLGIVYQEKSGNPDGSSI
jgi:hypothetical protein